MKMRRVWFTGTDQGDGSVGVEFFETYEQIEKLEEEDPETYRGEGGGWFEVPEGTKITGINICKAGEDDD